MASSERDRLMISGPISIMSESASDASDTEAVSSASAFSVVAIVAQRGICENRGNDCKDSRIKLTFSVKWAMAMGMGSRAMAV